MFKDINFDASASSSVTAKTLTFNHTNAGNILFVGVGYNVASMTIDSVTYNGVSMTQIGTGAFLSPSWAFLFYLVNPSLGTNSVSITLSGAGSPTIRGAASSYFNAAQTGVPDSFNQGTVTNTSFILSTTTVAQNCWTIFFSNASSLQTAGMNSTQRTNGNGWKIFDSNSPVSPGLFSMEETTSTSVAHRGVIASFAPAVKFKTINGVPIDNIKTIDGKPKSSVTFH